MSNSCTLYAISPNTTDKYYRKHRRNQILSAFDFEAIGNRKIANRATVLRLHKEYLSSEIMIRVLSLYKDN